MSYSDSFRGCNGPRTFNITVYSVQLLEKYEIMKLVYRKSFFIFSIFFVDYLLNSNFSSVWNFLCNVLDSFTRLSSVLFNKILIFFQGIINRLKRQLETLAWRQHQHSARHCLKKGLYSFNLSQRPLDRVNY